MRRCLERHVPPHRPARARVRWLAGPALLLAFFSMDASFDPAIATVAPQAPDLAPVLETMARVAELYRDTALGFVARERIQWTVPQKDRFAVGGKRRRRHTTQYDYFYVVEQDPRGRRLEDYRTRPDDRSGARVDPGQEVPAFVLRPYSWVFVFLKEQQGLYRFSFVEAGKAEGRAATVVAFEPVGTRYRAGIDEAFGRIWIDRETHAPLRVEAVRFAGIRRAQRRDPRVVSRNEIEGVVHEFHHFEIEYGVVKNSLRFPTLAELTVGVRPPAKGGDPAFRVQMREALADGLSGEKIFHRYDNYRFFSVRTEEEIRALIDGDS